MPGEFVELKIQKNNHPSQKYFIENRECKFLQSPFPTESVGYKIRIPNLNKFPIEVKKNTHFQVRKMKAIDINDTDDHEYPRKPILQTEPNLQEISIDQSKELFNENQVNKIKELLKEVQNLFYNDDLTYKLNYKASLEFSSETRPSLKNCKLPSYSSNHNNLLQQKCVKLWSINKIFNQIV